MEMIAHETIRMDLPAGLGAGFAEGGQESAMVEVILEDGLAAVATVHDVVDGAGIFDAEFTGHARQVADHCSDRQRKNMRICGTDPLTPSSQILPP